MKQIQAISKKLFDENFTDEKFKYYDYACFISILDVDNNEHKFDLTIDNFLQVRMWDIEKDIYNKNDITYKKPSHTELEKIVKFVNKHKDKICFIVHCSAGISRSGAVVTFIKEKFINEVDIDKFNKENKYIQPNLYVLKKLREIDHKYLNQK